MIADWHLENPMAMEGAFQNYLDRPSVRGLFERERAQNVRARGAERAEIGDLLLRPHRV